MNGPWGAGAGQPWQRRDWLLLAGVVALAALLRLPALEQVPPGLWRDEAGYGLAAQDIRAGILQVYWGDKEPLFPYLLALIFTLSGPTMLALRSTAALCGVATVGLTYLLGRELLGRAGGLVAAVALATSFWTLDLNRIGFRVNTMPLLVTLAFWLLWGALTHGGRWRWLAAGIALGLTPLTYLAARVAPLVVLVLALWLAIVDRRRFWEQRGGWGLLILSTLVTALPFLLFLAFNPSYLFDRASQLSPYTQARSVGEVVAITLSGVRDTAGMFFVRGDSEPRHNLPGRPVMDPLTAAVFLLGSAVAARWVREPAAALLLGWLVLLLLPSALAVDNPHFLRTLGAAPAVYLLVGLGASVLGQLAERVRLPGRLVPLLATLWLATAGLRTTTDYFFVWANDPQTARFFEAEVTAAARLLAAAPSSGLAYASAPFLPHPTVQFLAPAQRPVWFDGSEGLVLPARLPPAGALYALPGSQERAAALLQAQGAAVRAVAPAPDGTVRAQLLALPAGAAASLPPLPRPLAYRLGDRIDLTGVSELPPALQPGGMAVVTVSWTPRGPVAQPDLAFFVHLRDASGQTRGQHDAVTYPSFAWQGGEQVVSWFHVPVARDAPPGRYELVLGVYPRTTLQRLPAFALLAGSARPLGDTVLLGETKIPPPPPPEPSRPLAVRFADQILLEGVDLTGCALPTAQLPCQLDLTLYWRALASPGEDYQVFVHLADASGRPLAQADGPPLNGAYPTAFWSAGERVADRHRLFLPATLPPGRYHLLGGLYRLRDGSRLPAGATDAVELGVLQVGE
ncbi:MAG: glycosyltransferase family 39 protein [Chloroflexi bacterium]|nr:glycosyltransferase family 39 protein [Chloroflexota bacterium]